MAYVPYPLPKHLEAARLYLDGGADTKGNWYASCRVAGFRHVLKPECGTTKAAFERVRPGWSGILDISEQMDGQKACTKCHVIKPLGAFHRNKIGTEFRSSHCKACIREYGRMRLRKITSGTWDRWDHTRANHGIDRTPRATMVPSISNLHWAAGFLEGEGSFSVYSSHLVAAKQKEREPLERLQAFFGGNIYQEVIKTGVIYTWAVGGRRAIGVMLTMYSLLYSRRRGQIRRALGALNLPAGGVP